jgi:phosphatidylglycerol:prolipoprotein diacylglycerol transferase
MYTHNLTPEVIDWGFIVIRWYSLAYIFGILIGWFLAKKIIKFKFSEAPNTLDDKKFDDLINYLIISIILGGRIGYVIFYNLEYYLLNPIDILKIWQGGMSFHGALIGIVLGTYIFSIKKKIKTFILLDIIACVSPAGLFLGRISNFINAELIGKPTEVIWGVIYPNIDYQPRHPSQIYEAILEGVLLFLIINLIMWRKNYQKGFCSALFLFFYGIFRIIAEQFREPDSQIGYLFSYISMGSLLSFVMVLSGIVIFFNLNKNAK